jgi:hypothetical protein
MLDSQRFSTSIVAFVLAAGLVLVVGAPSSKAHARSERPTESVGLGLDIDRPDDIEQADLSLQVLGTSAVQLANNGNRGNNNNNDNRDRDRGNNVESRRRSGPSSTKIRGHEQNIQVRRRGATPIPRTNYSTKRRRGGYGRFGYSSNNYYHYGYGHTHHAHCGHDYLEYGDRYEARTLGRSCVYGPKGEVIYKPADIICAPEESATPTAAAEPAPASSTVVEKPRVKRTKEPKAASRRTR